MSSCASFLWHGSPPGEQQPMRKFWSKHVAGARLAAGMAILAALFSAAATAQVNSFTGPISPYYLSNYSTLSQTIYVVKGNAVIDTFPWASSTLDSSGMISVSSFVEARAYSDAPPPAKAPNIRWAARQLVP